MGRLKGRGFVPSVETVQASLFWGIVSDDDKDHVSVNGRNQLVEKSKKRRFP